jgi:hypothetical protein
MRWQVCVVYRLRLSGDEAAALHSLKEEEGKDLESDLS